MKEQAPAPTTRELQRMAEAPLRRPWLVIVPFLLSLAVAVTLSFLLPPRYRSSTLILVAPEQMPSELMPQMRTEKRDPAAADAAQEVQSRTRLEMIAGELDPYGTLGKEPLIDTIERMRAGVTVTVKGTDAFRHRVRAPRNRDAMLVADRLTTLFMDEVARRAASARSVRPTSSSRPRCRMPAGSSKRRRWRCARSRSSTWGSSRSRCRRTSRRCSGCSSSSRASPTACARRPIRWCCSRAPATPAAPPAPGASPRRHARHAARQMAQLKTRYTDQHPDVRALQGRIEALEKAAAAEEPGGAAPGSRRRLRQRRLKEARLEVESLRARAVDVDRRIAEFQARVEAAPRREQEVLGLMRDYQKLSENYTALLAKKLDAEMASRLEQQQKGQQFRVLDPPTCRSGPASPTRWLFALTGALVGILLGVGLAVTIDVLDPT